MRWFGRKERLLFTTHEPPSRVPAWAVGRVVEREGDVYRVTRWDEMASVALDRGGSVGQWGVWGRRVSDRQVRREIVDAAEAILGHSAGAEE